MLSERVIASSRAALPTAPLDFGGQQTQLVDRGPGRPEVLRLGIPGRDQRIDGLAPNAGSSSTHQVQGDRSCESFDPGARLSSSSSESDFGSMKPLLASRTRLMASSRLLACQKKRRVLEFISEHVHTGACRAAMLSIRRSIWTRGTHREKEERHGVQQRAWPPSDDP